MKTKLTEILQDDTGALSSKRTGFFVALLLFAIAFVWNMVNGTMINEHLLEYCFYLIVAGLGSITYEKYLSSRKKKDE